MRQVSTWQARALLNRSTPSRYGFDVTVNPYRGCAHACHYCYARDTHRYLELNIADDFSQKLFVKERSPAQIRKELGRLPLDQVIALGTATDPYQPLEGRYRITRHLLEAVVGSGHALTITTKSPLILRDLDLLKTLAKRGQVRVHVSLISLDRLVLGRLEPGAPSPEVRLRILAQLSQHRVPTVLFAAPILPYITDQEASLKALFTRARESGVDAVMASRLRLSPTVKPYFLSQLAHHYPDLAEAYQRLYPGSAQYPLGSYSHALNQTLLRLHHTLDLPSTWPIPRAWRTLDQPQFELIP